MKLIGDWGGFEKMIAALHETGDVQVQHDVKLTGQSGAPRQIDVLVTHTAGLYTHRVLVECKCWRRSVERVDVDAMITAVKDLNAARGVFFTTVGYQSGAETMAKANGIDLFLVRELTDDEWGGPGRVVDLYLHVIERGVGNLATPNASALTGRPPPAMTLGVRFGRDGAFETTTPAVILADADHPEEESTVERLLMAAFDQGAAEILGAPAVLQGGQPCMESKKARVSFNINRPIVVIVDGVAVRLRVLEFDMLVRTSQSRFIIDRGDRFALSLAVVNFITGEVHAGTRKRGDAVSKMVPLSIPQRTDEAAVANGTVVRMFAPAIWDISSLPSKRPDLVPYVYDMTRAGNGG